jgi:sulfur-oxidizing protein SoxX
LQLALVLVGALAASPSIAAAQSTEAAGLALMTANCMQCHQVKGIENAGNIGPVLSDMKSRFPERKDLVAVIFDESKRNPQTVMPPFGRNLILTNEQIDTVVDLLYTR